MGIGGVSQTWVRYCLTGLFQWTAYFQNKELLQYIYDETKGKNFLNARMFRGS